MNVSMKFTVDGKDYSNDIEGGVNAMFHAAIIEQVEERLKDIMPEIEAHGGTISFDLNTSQLSIDNCTPELINKIEERFQ
jgi:hypothetical protein